MEARDGYEFGGQRLRVEISRGAGGPGGPPRGDYGGGGGGGGGGSRNPRERGGREPPPVPRTFEGRGTGFRATIKGLPMSASWQDLKVWDPHESMGPAMWGNMGAMHLPLG